MNILCFGDSNTYGYKPDRTGRFDESIRWTGLLQKKLGPDYHIIEEGLCGRTTVFQDELREGRRGLDLIGVTVEMQTPVDLMILMLGTNDCKTRYGASATVIARGLDQVIRKARKSSPTPFDILVISPIHLGKGVGEPDFDPEFNSDSEAVSRNLAAEYRKVALQNHAAFLNAADFAFPSVTDREHLDEAGHAALADAVYTARVLEYLDMSVVRDYPSVDVYQNPQKKKEEIFLSYPDHDEYVSREFPNKEKIMRDREITSTKCPHCHLPAKRKLRWFQNNSRVYESLSFCQKHGWVKGKIRIRHTDEDGYYAVKTLKNIDEIKAEELRQKRESLRQKRQIKRQSEKHI